MKSKPITSFLLFLILTCFFPIGFAVATNTGGEKVITDITHWNHPVKTVCQQYNIVIVKLILQKNNTYPIFFVRFPEPLNPKTIQYYRNFIENVAIANAYWDYTLIDEQQQLTLEIICNRKEKVLNNVVINHDTQYYHRLLREDSASDNETDRILDYLVKRVPEIESYRQMIAAAAKEKKAGNPSRAIFIMRVDGKPDPDNFDIYLRDYFSVYVGEDHNDHTVRWKTFLIKKDLSEILVDDPLNGEYLTLPDWRKREPQDQ